MTRFRRHLAPHNNHIAILHRGQPLSSHHSRVGKRYSSLQLLSEYLLSSNPGTNAERRVPRNAVAL